MRQLKFKSSLAVILIMLHLLLITTCDKNPTEAKKKEPPLMPPATSMQVDLSLFSSPGNVLAKENAFSKVHFTTAVFTVSLINLGVLAGMATPVFIFAQALSVDPVLQEDGKFHWVYTANYELLKYTADLAGWIDVPNKQAAWEMYVTQAGLNLNHFMWYDGRCNLDATAGYWIFYDHTQPNSAVTTIRIDWINNSETDRVLTFTNVTAGSPYEGDQLKYTINGNDRSVEFKDASEGTTAIIFWDTATKAGYIQAPNYNNGQKGCWDQNQNDVTCP